MTVARYVPLAMTHQLVPFWGRYLSCLTIGAACETLRTPTDGLRMTFPQHTLADHLG